MTLIIIVIALLFCNRFYLQALCGEIMNNYRQNLETEKEQLLSMLPHVRPDEKARGVKRVREIIDALNEMDNGANWSQEPGDTQAEIVLSEVRSSTKVMVQS